LYNFVVNLVEIWNSKVYNVFMELKSWEVKLN